MIHVYGADNIELDHVTVFGGFPALLVNACKNIGVTHVTNGCFRLHPTEWSIGEAAGHLAAFCVEKPRRPRAVRADGTLLAAFQRRLERAGVELQWPGGETAMSYHSYRVDQDEWYWGEATRR